MTFIKKHSVTSRIIFKYLLEHRLKIFLALIMMVISAAATGLHAWLVRPALDEVLIKGNKEMLFLIPIAIIIVTLIKLIIPEKPVKQKYLHMIE
mgnify:CR=1 FL=1